MMKIKSILVFMVLCSILINACGQRSNNSKHEKTESDRSTVETMKKEQRNNLNFIGNTDEQLICKLTKAEQLKRKDKIRKQLFAKVKKVEEIENGYAFLFDYEVDFLLRLTDWTIAENNCCPFFTFNTTLHGEDDIRLQITGPERAKELLGSFIVNQLGNEKNN